MSPMVDRSADLTPYRLVRALERPARRPDLDVAPPFKGRLRAVRAVPAKC